MSNSTHPFPIAAEPYASVSFSLVIFGVCSNGLVIAATVRKDSDLRDKSNWLICALALFDLLSCLTAVNKPILLWMGKTFISNKECFLVQIPELLTLDAENFLIWSVSIDRLLILLKPLKHSAWDLKCYVAGMLAPALVYSTALVAVGAIYTTPDAIVATCVPPTAMHGPATAIFLGSGLVLCVLITVTNICCYFASKNQSNTSEVQRRLRGSVGIIGLVYCFTTMSAFGVASLVHGLQLEPETANAILLYLGWLVFANQCSNPIIYAARSKHYRNAFKVVLGLKQQGQVAPSNTQRANNTKPTHNSQHK